MGHARRVVAYQARAAARRLPAPARILGAVNALASVDETHDPALQSWVESANHPASDFPLQTLPFGRFRSGTGGDWRVGVAIGDQVLDLQRTGLAASNDIAALMGQAPPARRELRQQLSAGLRSGSSRQAQWQTALLPQSGVQMGLP